MKISELRALLELGPSSHNPPVLRDLFTEEAKYSLRSKKTTQYP